MLVGGDALERADTATTVRERDGQTQFTGLFAETKEFLAGYYLVDCPDLDTALDHASRMPNIAYGSAGGPPGVGPDGSDVDRLRAGRPGVTAAVWVRRPGLSRSPPLRCGARKIGDVARRERLVAAARRERLVAAVRVLRAIAAEIEDSYTLIPLDQPSRLAEVMRAA